MSVPSTDERPEPGPRHQDFSEISPRDWEPFVAVYEELRRAARRQLGKAWDEHSLGPTGLVHEVVLRLIRAQNVTRHSDPSYVFAAALQAMRRIVCERARTRGRMKNGRGLQRIALDDVVDYFEAQNVKAADLHEALGRLARRDPRLERVVTLRYFLLMTNREIADHLCVSLAKAEGELRMARAWLRRELGDAPEGSPKRGGRGGRGDEPGALADDP